MKALEEDGDYHKRVRNLLVYYYGKVQPWSDRCPSIKHVTTTHPEIVLPSCTKITHLSMKGIIGRSNIIGGALIDALAQGTSSLTDLVLDGISL